MIVTTTIGYGQRVIVTINTEGATPASLGGTMTLYRTPAGGVRTPVAGAVAIPASSTVIPDVSVELERAVVYEVITANGTTAAAASVTVATVRSAMGPMCLITHPVSGAVAPVVLVQWTKRDMTTQSSELEIPDRDEVIHLVGVEMLPTGAPDWLTLDADAAAALAAILKPGEIVLCRMACSDYPDVYVAVRSRSTERVGRHGPGLLHAWTVTEHRHPSMGIRASGDTLQVLHDAMPTTLQSIANRWTTLLSLASTDLLGEVSS